MFKPLQNSPAANRFASNGNPQPRKTFTRSRGVIRAASKIGIYGPEGVGKSTLAASFPGVVFADLEQSTRDMDVERVTDVHNWLDLRGWVQSANPSEYPAICIDSMTRAEDWAMEYVIANKRDSDGAKATDSIEDFKFKAGLKFICDEFRRFLGDLDAAFLRGVNIIMVSHNRIGRVRNPDGSDFIRNEPRLLNEEKGSNMLPWVQFLDHLFFIDYDMAVTKGKAVGGGSRTMYTTGTPNRMAKSRTLPPEPIIYERGSSTVWDLMLSRPALDMPPE